MFDLVRLVSLGVVKDILEQWLPHLINQAWGTSGIISALGLDILDRAQQGFYRKDCLLPVWSRARIHQTGNNIYKTFWLADFSWLALSTVLVV